LGGFHGFKRKKSPLFNQARGEKREKKASRVNRGKDLGRGKNKI